YVVNSTAVWRVAGGNITSIPGGLSSRESLGIDGATGRLLSATLAGVQRLDPGDGWTTVAGNGNIVLGNDLQGTCPFTLPRDGSGATSTPVDSIASALGLADGTLFIGQVTDNLFGVPSLPRVIRRVDPTTHVLSTWAGSATCCLATSFGDPATSARLG